MEADEDLYHAFPQVRGRIVHESLDSRKYSTRKSDITGLSVFSETLGVMGKIDLYKSDICQLVERKYSISQIFRGQLYQLWAEYYCMVEMGYSVKSLAFYEISKNRTIPVNLPGLEERYELENMIDSFRSYVPSKIIETNPNKCRHCIYINLCDKTDEDNVY